MDTFRKGDIVSIECVVETAYPGLDLHVRQVGKHTAIFVSRDEVKLVRHDIEVGDFVQLIDVGHIGEVIAISEDHLWVTFGTGSYGTWWINKVIRVDAPQVTIHAVDGAEVEEAQEQSDA